MCPVTSDHVQAVPAASAALTEAAQADKLISDRLQKFIANATNGTGLDGATVAADQNTANHREDIPDASAGPAAVNAWWQGLTPAERHHLIYNQPDQIGNRDGIPTVDRDQANRLRLAQNQATLQSQLDALGPEPPFFIPVVGVGDNLENPEHKYWKQQHDDLTGKLKGLNDIQNRLDNSRGPDFPPTYLMGFDTQGNGHAIVAMNNPDTADNVLTFVPGTSARLAGITGDMDKAYEMEASSAKAEADQHSSKTTATIAWSGYDAPQTLPEASLGGPAFGAEDRLHNFETGLRATHEGTPSFNTIMGHSYGSTAVGFTMRDKGLPVDRAIFVGSPGLGVYSPSELHLDPSQVFVGRGSNDPIEYVAGVAFGSDPMDSDFGAQHLPTGDSNHSSYWDRSKPAWSAFGKIATGGQP
ncbi:alpha/beta hydrolase [Kitasatospora kifunensis]|uniref:DUF1023 domain-containing protein n=1 Tax=Kitasatospora kifunensis TaxID=58351 RepID=A0A7W7QY92_KITKI|nr:alpha/beta hydrolase [Kitasatospora kifunensis]MBB4921992.1 hypothetical protein [Kitasatospora kifunensis]